MLSQTQGTLKIPSTHTEDTAYCTSCVVNVREKNRGMCDRLALGTCRLIFTSGGDGVVIRSVRLRRLRSSSKSQAQAEDLYQSHSVGTIIAIGLSFCFRLQQSGFHQIISDGVISRFGRKWKSSDSSDSVVLMTQLATPIAALIFHFHWVISALTTPLTSPIQSPVKTSLKNSSLY